MKAARVRMRYCARGIVRHTVLPTANPAIESINMISTSSDLQNGNKTYIHPSTQIRIERKYQSLDQNTALERNGVKIYLFLLVNGCFAWDWVAFRTFVKDHASILGRSHGGSRSDSRMKKVINCESGEFTVLTVGSAILTSCFYRFHLLRHGIG
jgi:hypothetical protein